MGHSELRHLISQVTVMHVEVLLFWKSLNTCQPMGSSEKIPYLDLLVCTALLHFLNS